MAILVQSSKFKLQLERKATTCSKGQQEAFYLQDELAEVICAHPQEMYSAAHVRFNEHKDSSSFSKLPITPTHSQDNKTCAKLPMLNVRASKNLRDIENFP